MKIYWNCFVRRGKHWSHLWSIFQRAFAGSAHILQITRISWKKISFWDSIISMVKWKLLLPLLLCFTRVWNKILNGWEVNWECVNYTKWKFTKYTCAHIPAGNENNMRKTINCTKYSSSDARHLQVATRLTLNCNELWFIFEKNFANEFIWDEKKTNTNWTSGLNFHIFSRFTCYFCLYGTELNLKFKNHLEHYSYINLQQVDTSSPHQSEYFRSRKEVSFASASFILKRFTLNRL